MSVKILNGGFYRIAVLFVMFSACSQYDMLSKLEDPGSAIGYKVFVTSIVSDGNFFAANGGFATGGCYTEVNAVGIAACVCRHLASTAGIARENTTFKPWLSAGAGDARCLLQGLAGSGCHVGDAGPWYNMKGQMISPSLGELLIGSLRNAIRYNENGAEAAGSEAWTGTNYLGNIAASTCVNASISWQSTAGSGTAGFTRTTDASWTDATLSDGLCTVKRSIYCFEVKK